ncbi:MAG: DegT/DnrJ/EryC1/StrS family aminotransferase [Bacillota bacterium]|nr:DegT/DnrJ/EryC1/StrS family aminotransferase [Bacillota bacterium]
MARREPPSWSRAPLAEGAPEALAAWLRRGELDALDGSGAVRRFERAMAARLGVGWALATASGTAALEAALAALELQPGETLLAAPFAPAYVYQPVLRAGARLAWVDVEAEGLGLDPADALGRLEAEERAGARVRALLAVHVAGYPARLGPLLEPLARRGVALLEDAAQALGARLPEGAAGAVGTAGFFSFQGAKLLPLGEGGLLATRMGDLYRRALRAGQHPARIERELGEAGAIPSFQHRLNPLAAALGLAQLPALDGWLERRRRRAGEASRFLREATGGELQVLGAAPGFRPAWLQLGVRLPQPLAPEALEELCQAAVEGGADLDPLPELPPPGAGGPAPGELPRAEEARRRTLLLGGAGSLLAEEEAFREVLEAVVAAWRKIGRSGRRPRGRP